MELGVCHHYRVPHSEFLRWPDSDRDKAIWIWLRERSACSSCGTRPDEWEPAKGGHRRAYRADLEICRGCQALDARSKALTEKQRGESGLQLVLKRREVTNGEQT